VKINAGMGADAVLGKAYRKMYFRIWQRLHGSTFGLADGDVSDADAINTTGEPAQQQPAGGGQPRSTGSKVEEMAAKARAAKAAKSEPPAANDTGELTIDKVRNMLGQVDEEWHRLSETVANAIIEAWSAVDRRRAHTWAVAFANTPNDLPPPEQPEFTLLERTRQPGEEG
jgi:hypothetical protein